MSAVPDIFADTPLAPPDAVFGVVDRYNKALAAWKTIPADQPGGGPNCIPISLVVGAYRDNDGKPWVLPTVRKIEKELAESPALEHEYLKITGLPQFLPAAQKLMFGETSELIASAQALSGTGSLYIGFLFLVEHMKSTNILLPKPTWPNHPNIAKAAHLVPDYYPYYDDEHNKVLFDEMVACIQQAKAGTIILLHACAHNPTGMDLQPAQWGKLCSVFEEKHAKGETLIPFFDCAYQGYASGDLNKDAYSVRLFLKHNLPIIVAQSFSKTMGLYGERCGCLHINCGTPETKAKVISQLSAIIRRTYSNPPGHGAKIATALLTNEEHYKSWLADLETMTVRLKSMREALRKAIEANQEQYNKLHPEKTITRTWNHITEQQGMFSFTGLTKAQVEYVITKHNIFLTANGRISISGLTTTNVDRVGAAVVDAVANA